MLYKCVLHNYVIILTISLVVVSELLKVMLIGPFLGRQVVSLQQVDEEMVPRIFLQMSHK